MLNIRRNSLVLFDSPKVKKDMDQFRRAQQKTKSPQKLKKTSPNKKRLKGLDIYIYINAGKVGLRCHGNSFQIYKRLLQRGRECIHGLLQGDQ